MSEYGTMTVEIDGQEEVRDIAFLEDTEEDGPVPLYRPVPVLNPGESYFRTIPGRVLVFKLSEHA